MNRDVALRRTLGALGALAAWLLSPPALRAQQTELTGDWFLTLNEGRALHTGILTIERSGGALVAFVDGGPASLKVEGDAIALDFDTRDGGGQLLSYSLQGRVDGNEIKGELTPPLDAPKGTWHAARHVVPPPAPPKPPLAFFPSPRDPPPPPPAYTLPLPPVPQRPPPPPPRLL